MNGRFRALAGRISVALEDLSRVVSRTELLAAKAQQTGDDGYWDAVALNLHGFYAGTEHVLEDIARTVDESLPDGAGWHQDLLLQMSAEVKAVRPPVLSQATRHCLDEYRGFRHVVRNVYTFNLNPTRLAALSGGLRSCLEMTAGDLSDFSAFVLRLAESETAIDDGPDD